MDKILIIILIVIAVSSIKDIMALETLTFPLWNGGTITYLGWLADSIKVFFSFLIIIALIWSILFIKHIFRGTKKRKLKNERVTQKSTIKKTYVSDIENFYESKEEFIEKNLKEDYAEIKEITLSENDLAIVKDIKKIDYNFNERFFIIKAQEFSQELIKTELVKHNSAKYVYESFNTGKIDVGIPTFHSFEKIDKYYAIKLRVSKYRNNKIAHNYEMLFLKIEVKDSVALKCPRCGAPLQKKLGGICRYCFKYNDTEGKKKVKSNVSKFSYDVPIIKFKPHRRIPSICINCGAPLKKEHKGICEYCKSDNRAIDSEWVMMDFYKIK